MINPFIVLLLMYKLNKPTVSCNVRSEQGKRTLVDTLRGIGFMLLEMLDDLQ